VSVFFVISTAISIHLLCSARVSVALSPVVPTGQTAFMPLSICLFIRFAYVCSSSFPFLNGVINAVVEPVEHVQSSSAVI